MFAALVTLACVAGGPQLITKANIAPLKPVNGRLLTQHAGEKEGKVAIAPHRQHGKKVSFGKSANIHRAAYECTYSDLNYEDYGTDTWFCITTNDQAYKFYFDIKKPMYDIHVNQTYTLDDCDPSFTYVSDNTTYEMMWLEDLSIVFRNILGGGLAMEAQCTTKKGDSFHLTYEPLVLPDTFTEVAVGNLELRLTDFIKENSLFQFTGLNDVYDLGICVATDNKVEGNWTYDDLDKGYTYLYKEGKELRLCNVEMQVASLGEHNYHVDAKMYSYDGNVYVINQDYIEPTLENTAEIVATNLKIDDSMFDIYKGFYGYGLADITASNEEYTITLLCLLRWSDVRDVLS